MSTAFWEAVFWGNTVGRWTVALGVAIGGGLVLRIAASVVAGRLKTFAVSTENDIDDLIADLLDRTKLLFIVIVGLWAGAQVLTLSPGAERVARVVLILGLLLQTAFWATAIVNYGLNRYRTSIEDDDPGVVTALGAVSFLIRLAIWSVLGLFALDALGIDITALVAGLGVGGIAVALAVQNVLGDLFASLAIILDKPFVVGDFIIVGDYEGTVEHVGLKTTHMRSLSGEQLVIANSDLLSSRIRNYKRMEERRIAFQLGVVYGTPSDKLTRIPEIIRGAVESQDKARFDRSHLKSFGPSSLDFETVYYMTVPDYASYMDAQQAINLELYSRFEDEGLEFAYPTQTLFLRSESAEAEAG